MARGNLPAQTPIVPRDVFVAFDLVYRFILGASTDLDALEGLLRDTTTSVASSTVLAADTKLQFPILPLQKIRFQAELFFSANCKFRHVGPAGASLVMIDRYQRDTAGLTTALDVAFSAADIAVANAAYVRLSGIIHNGATAGTVSFQWAQNASNVTPSSLYAGSLLRYSLID
jgi:hypothetical protein